MRIFQQMGFAMGGGTIFRFRTLGYRFLHGLLTVALVLQMAVPAFYQVSRIVTGAEVPVETGTSYPLALNQNE
jgi:hypothetical protein